MHEIMKCPCCTSNSFIVRHAIVSPFITEYVLREKELQYCLLLKCNCCGFSFFNKRFSEDEAQKLYGHYRQEEYFKIRHKHEFYYTREINESIEDVSYRRKLIDDFLENISLDYHKLKNVLDYGGDRGQFFPSNFQSSTKWLYDLSSYDPIEGVHKIKELQLGIDMYDVIFLSHVLEHVSFPDNFLAHICQYIRESGYLYIEIPYEAFSFKPNTAMWYKNVIALISKHRAFFMLIDIYSLFFRLRLKFVPFLGIVKLHEHINFYTMNSLKILLKNNGFKIIKIQQRRARNKIARDHVIQCLAMKEAFRASIQE